MANFQLDPKRVVINSPEQHPLQYFNVKANGAWEPVVVAADQPAADILVISGFAKLFSGQVTKAIGRKGIAALPQISTLTIGAGFAAAIGTDKEFTLKLQFKSLNLESENANWDGKFGRPRTFPFIVKSGDSVTDIATRIVNVLKLDQNLREVYLSEISNAAGVITFKTKHGGLELKAYVEETTTATFAITQPAFGGRGSYEVMKNVRIETPARIYPYSFDTAEIPVKGQLYSSYEFYQTVQRPDLSNSSVANGGPVAGSYGFEMFINQTTSASVITAITKWLNANVPSRTMWPATTPAGTIGETPTVQSAIAADPYTTGLV